MRGMDAVAWWVDPRVLILSLGTLAISLLVFALVRALLNTRFTALKMAERLTKELRESQVRIELAIRASDLILFEWDIPAHRVNFGGLWTKVLGYGPEEVGEAEADWMKLVHPDDWTGIREALRSHFRGDTPFCESEQRLRHKDGRWVWVRAFGRVVECDSNGAPIRAAGASVDITSRRTVEEALRRSRAELLCVLASTADGILAVDVNRDRILANEQFVQLWGIPSEILASKSDEKMLARVRDQVIEPEAFVRRVEALYSSAEVAMDTIGLKDGRVLDRFSAPLIFENVLAGRVWSFRDVTARHRAAEALRESEEKYSLVVQNASEAIFVLQDGVVVFANPASGQLLGVPESEVIGRSTLEFLSREDHEVEVRLRKRLLSGELRSGRAEYRVSTAKGSELWARIDSVAISWKGAPATLNIASDITEAKRAEFSLRKSGSEIRSLNTELERRVAERTAELEAFAYTVAHDLKAPLRGIDGFSAVLQEEEGERLTDEGRRMLGRIRAASQRGGRLIEDLLRLARLTKVDLRLGQIDLSALAVRVSRKIQAGQPDRRVEWVIEPGLAANADAGLVEEILEQLLGNAWKFTSKQESARIEFGAAKKAEKDGKRVFFVKDDGAGFDMAHAGELFGAFHRAHTDAEFPGLGIGLTIVRKIVRRHGGAIWAEGEPGKGATVLFTL